MEPLRIAVVDPLLLCAYGSGIGACWEGLASGRTASATVSRFPCDAFPCRTAALIPGLDPDAGSSLVRQMLDRLFPPGYAVPRDASLWLATSVGEIDLVERHVLAGTGDPANSLPHGLAGALADRFRLGGFVRIVSAACSSSAVAVGAAADAVRNGRTGCALVVACDAVSEFVFSGFASLMALDPDSARPFDAGRRGLILGEAAAAVLIMDEARARAEGRTVVGRIAGWGTACDGNHMTGPSREGSGLVRSIELALRSAGLDPAGVDAVCAHGTGTPYNDAMEMTAFRRVFGATGPVPVFSVKGGIGHTLGAAGLAEILIALEGLRRAAVPPTVGLQSPDDAAAGWVTPGARPLPRARAVLSTNSGFGGVNSVVVLRAPTESPGEAPA